MNKCEERNALLLRPMYVNYTVEFPCHLLRDVVTVVIDINNTINTAL